MYSVFFIGGWDLLCGIKRACAFVCTVCVFVLHTLKKNSAGRGRGAGGGGGGGGGVRQMEQTGGG